MKNIENFFKRIKVNEDDIKPTNTKVDDSNIEIEIQGDVNLFIDEKEKILEGANKLLELGRAENIEEAIITFATIFRGLKFMESKNVDGKRVIILRETVRGEFERDIE